MSAASKQYIKQVEQAVVSADLSSGFISIQFPDNINVYQEAVKGLLELNLRFMLRGSQLTDSWASKGNMQTGLQLLMAVHQANGLQCPPKAQCAIVEAFFEQCGEIASTTSEAGTVGGEMIGLNIQACSSFFEPLQKKEVLKNILPSLVKVLNNSNGKLSENAKMTVGTIISSLSANAKSLMKENAVDFWNIGLQTRNTEILLSIATQSLEIIRFELWGTFDKFMDIYNNDILTVYKTQYWQYFNHCSIYCPDKMFTQLEMVIEGLEQNVKYYACQVLENLAKYYPDELYNHFKEIEEVSTDQMHGYMAGNVIGKIGKYTQNEQYAQRCIQFTIDMLQNSKVQNISMVATAQMEILYGGFEKVEIFKNNFIPQLKKQLNHSEGMVVKQTKDILDIVEGRTLKEFEEKLKNIKNDLEDFLTAKVGQMTANVKTAVKSLPMPVDFIVKSGIRSTVYLKFECAQHKDENCSYRGHNVNTQQTEEGDYFTTETKDLNKWFKVGANIFSAGASILTCSPSKAVQALGNTYKAAMEDENKGESHFRALMEEPFLTSEEQDRLILQLRKANYFDNFSFSPAHNGWVCTKCKPYERVTTKSKETAQKKQQQQKSGAQQGQKNDKAQSACCTIF